MRRGAVLLVFLVLASACGGGSDAGPPAIASDDAAVVTSTTAATDPGEPAPRDVGSDPACQELGDWLGAVAFGGPAGDPAERIRDVAASLDEPHRSQVLAAVGSSAIDYGVAAELDVTTVAQCGIPLAEGARVAARDGAPDCYLDAGREVIVESICSFGGQPITVAVSELSDATFCGTVQDFVRNGSGNLTGQAAIDELNAFVDAAPIEVERVLRDVVSATSAGDSDDQLAELFALDRIVAAGCGDAVANDYLPLVIAAIAAVPEPTPTAPPGSTPAQDDPGTVAGGSPFVTLCQGIERRFAGSAASEWGLVLDIAVSVGAPADVVNILTQLADPEVKGPEAREPLVAALGPFLDGPCQDTGLDQAEGEGPSGESPEEGGQNDDEEEGIPSLL